MFEHVPPRKPKVIAQLSALEVENAKQLAQIVHVEGYDLGIVLSATAHALQRAANLRAPGAQVHLAAKEQEVVVEFSIQDLAAEEEAREVLTFIWNEKHPEEWHLIISNSILG